MEGLLGAEATVVRMVGLVAEVASAGALGAAFASA